MIFLVKCLRTRKYSKRDKNASFLLLSLKIKKSIFSSTFEKALQEVFRLITVYVFDIVMQRLNKLRDD